MRCLDYGGVPVVVGARGFSHPDRSADPGFGWQEEAAPSAARE
jgi:hypothetical protein